YPTHPRTRLHRPRPQAAGPRLRLRRPAVRVGRSAALRDPLRTGCGILPPVPASDAAGPWRRADGETPEQLAALTKHFPTPRDAVAYIMDQFPIVRDKDEKAHGRYRTKDRILEIY